MATWLIDTIYIAITTNLKGWLEEVAGQAGQRGDGGRDRPDMLHSDAGMGSNLLWQLRQIVPNQVHLRRKDIR